MAGEEFVRPSTFRVEVPNPERIYTLARNMLSIMDSDMPIDEELSETSLKGELVGDEFTSLMLISEDTEKGFSLSSNIKVGKVEQKSPQQGYFTDDQVTTIQATLRQHGIDSNIRHIQNRHALDISLAHNVRIAVDLGFKSKEYEAARFREAVEAPLASIRKAAFRALTKQTESRFANEELTLQMFMIAGEKGLAAFLEGLGPSGFSDIVTSYTQGYQQIMEAIHIAKGRKLPEKPIILNSPYEVDTVLKLD